MSDTLPDCMMPDGGSACIAYHERCEQVQQLKRERDAALAEAETWKRVANNYEAECVRRRKIIEDARNELDGNANPSAAVTILREALEVGSDE